MRPREPGPHPWRFLDDTEHPFDARVLDMRPLAVGAHSSPQDAKTRERFGTSRREPPGTTHDAEFARRYPITLTYPRPPGPPQAWLFRAKTFEEKWDVSMAGDHLVAWRSWTGTPVLRARMRVGPEELVLDRIEAAEDWADDLAPRHLDFLVWTMLFGRPVPHPVPPGMLDDPEAAARWSFGLHGRHAWFACEADLTEALRAERQG